VQLHIDMSATAWSNRGPHAALQTDEELKIVGSDTVAKAIRVLTIQMPLVTIHTVRFNFQQFYVLFRPGLRLFSGMSIQNSYKEKCNEMYRVPSLNSLLSNNVKTQNTKCKV